ncbi:MAG TPA: hypothetical protein VK604_19040, partial [Bryobacteraceae bacterium]|nr:hypothetical protein [Bryobacteraceae bacterium]
ATDSPLKRRKVIPDGHSEGEEFFEGFLGCGKLDGDLARGERNPSRKVGKHLIDDGGRSLDGHPMPGRFVQGFEGPGEALAALALVGSGVASGQLPQMGNKQFPVGEAIGADLERDAGGEDLLGAAAADAEQAFDGGAIDPGLGQGTQLRENLV